MNSILLQDIEEICSTKMIDWAKMKNKKIFITGATGLIGSILVKSLLKKNEKYDLNVHLLLLVRNIEKAKTIFGESKYIDYIESEIERFNNCEENVDYIIHAASPTKSKYFIENPVETLNTAIIGTKNVLNYAKCTNAESVVYLSSMEMYGFLNDKNVNEDKLGYINPLDVRSSYSEGKRLCELYCYSYFSEYNVPVKIARLAQTFGAGISKQENRVYKQFTNNILNGEDIVLKSSGNTIINFSYTSDTIIAILVIMLKGKDGEAYNIVSDNSNMTILDSANWLIDKYGNGKNKVRFEIPESRLGFAPDNKMILDNKKLKKLGWNWKYDLKAGYDRLIEYLKEEKMY